jgi:hypothetical protein
MGAELASIPPAPGTKRPQLTPGVNTTFTPPSERSKRSYRDDKFRKSRLLVTFGGQLATDVRARTWRTSRRRSLNLGGWRR